VTSSSTTDQATAYAVRVVEGKVVAGPHVRNACRRHLDDLKIGAARGLRYSEEEAARVIRFFETKLKLSEGQFEGEPLVLHESQAFIIGSLFGWQKEHPKHGWIRRFRRVYIEQGKGNGKSPIAGGIGLFGLMSDREPGAEIYSAGATKDQAGILFRDAIKMRGQSPDIATRTKTSGGEGREFNLAYLAKGSFFRPISREAKKTGSGPRPHMALCDEVHEHPDRGVMEMLERGFKFRRQPMLLMITNSGSDRNSICWEEHVRAVQVAAGNRDAKDDDPTYLGEVIDENADTQFSYVCALDKGDDPLNDPSCWPKANPLLGVTIEESYLRDVVAQAKAMPGKLNGILRLHFCQWTDAETAWITRETLEPCLADFDPAIHHGKRIAQAIDLSQNRDITAKASIVETGSVEVKVIVAGKPKTVSKPTYDCWIEAWTPGDTLAARELRDKAPYSVWVRDGHLNAPKGESIRFDHVAQALADDDRDYDIALVGYDRYAFRRFEDECKNLGLSVEFVEHPQGGTKKGKPNEAMIRAAKAENREPEGLWMPGSLRAMEEAILEKRIRFKRNPVLISAMMSAVTDEDRWENRWLAKDRATNKIDAAVAACMALGTAMAMERSNATAKYQMLVFG
jgi:phage terminase large subunit-like protein